jgi:hypothetical protein
MSRRCWRAAAERGTLGAGAALSVMTLAAACAMRVTVAGKAADVEVV